MNPLLSQAAFSLGLTIFLMALIVLPFIDPRSPEFVADVLALGFSGFFTFLIVYWARRMARIPPITSKNPGHESETAGADEG